MMDELIAGSFSLDLSANVPFPIDLSIADFREPEKRSRNLSKEIVLPGTARNRQFFQNNFNLTSIGAASARVSCDYRKDGISVLPNGVLKLNSVVDTDGVLAFKVTVFSDFVDIFLALAQKQVKELNWSDLNHNLTVAAIQASWTTPNGAGYYYPLIIRRPKPSATTWDTTDMIPYVFMADVFRRCMAFVGQKYTSNFLNSALARRVLYGYGGGAFVDNAVTPAELALRSTVVSVNTTPIVITGQTWFGDSQLLPRTDIPITIVNSPLNPVVLANNEVTIVVAGNYLVRLTATLDITDSIYAGDFNLLFFKNDAEPPYLDFQVLNGDASTPLSFIASANVVCAEGDRLKFIISAETPNFDTPVVTRTVVFSASTLTVSSTDTAIISGSTIEVGRFLPQQSCAEFVLGIIKAFNLYVSAPNAQGVITIEPQKTFYSSTNQFKDITPKVDLSKPIEIRPSAIEFAKKLSYTWKQAPESDARSHANKWLREYGSFSFEQSNHYAKGEQKIDLPFATCIPFQVAPNLIAPRFCKVEGTVITALDGPPRLMFKQGLKTGSWRLRTTNFTTYPGAHHFDNWQNPQNDLNFGLTPELYYLTNIVTTRNLYANYYEKQVKQVIDPDGKVVQMYVELDPEEVAKIDFSLNIMYDGSLFTLNRVFDFDSNFSATTKIELLKVGEATNRPLGQIPRGNVVAVNAVVVKSPTNSEGTGVVVVNGGRNATLATSKVTRIG